MSSVASTPARESCRRTGAAPLSLAQPSLAFPHRWLLLDLDALGDSDVSLLYLLQQPQHDASLQDHHPTSAPSASSQSPASLSTDQVAAAAAATDDAAWASGAAGGGAAVGGAAAVGAAAVGGGRDAAAARHPTGALLAPGFDHTGPAGTDATRMAGGVAATVAAAWRRPAVVVETCCIANAPPSLLAHSCVIAMPSR